MRKYDTSIRTGSALRNLGGMPAMAWVALGIATAAAAAPLGTTAIRPIAEMTEPGAIGTIRRPQFGPRPDGVFLSPQPVEIRGPVGLSLSVETATGWSSPQPLPLRIGFEPGRAYRLRLTDIPGKPADVLYPSLQVLAPLAAPPGQRWRFPIELVIDRDDLDEASAGSHIRRVVYLSHEPEAADVLASRWFDARPGDDCLEVARTLGEPVAELRIGNRLPLLPAGMTP
jgi:hypothetical protein